MAKSTSKWIDNAKLRKELYDFNQAVKSVYERYQYVNGIVVPRQLSDIKNYNLFMNSFFTRTDNHWEFINNCNVNPEELNTALKNKCYVHDETMNGHYLHTEDMNRKSWYRVSSNMEESDISALPSRSPMRLFKMLTSKEPLWRRELYFDEREQILANKMLDKEIAKDGMKSVTCLVGKELLPMVKRTQDITFTAYEPEEKVSDVYPILIASKLPTWTFYSMHHILVF